MNDLLQTAFMAVLVSLYGISIIYLVLYGLNTLGLTILYLVNRRKIYSQKKNRREPAEWPPVTIQLPVFNESLMVDRLLKAITALDYPRDRLQIQVLDDSTDETTEISQALVTKYKAKGFDINLLHRTNREGYKAGALSEGLKTATGEFVAIFDADFVPPSDWLKRVVMEFDRPDYACLQTRWGHLNSRYNLLTRIQTLGLDGHFIVEQGARYGSNLLMGFNGSAGIWRKAAIEDAGGWAWDTLTEDLDLSYRAQMKGWRIKYNPEIIVPAELPAHMDAFKVQQFRWAKGSVQTLIKLGIKIIRAPLPLYKRVFAISHMAMYVPYPFTVLTLLLTLPMVLWATPMLKFFSFSVIASLGPPLLYAVAQTHNIPRIRDRLLRLPLLMMLAIGVSLNTSLAVISGIFSKGGVFNRTPKFNLKDRQGSWTASKYRLPLSPVVWGEVFMGFYALFSLMVLWPTPAGKALSTFFLFYAAGFLWVAGISISQAEEQNRAEAHLEPVPIPTTGQTRPVGKR